MPKISSYTAKSVANRGDMLIGVDNSATPPETMRISADNLVSMAYGGIGFVGNAVNSGVMAVWTIVNKFTTALEEKTFASTASNNYIDVPVGEGGTYELHAELSCINDTGERIFNIRITNGGAAIAGTVREFSVALANRPYQGTINFTTVLSAGARLRLECIMVGPAATTGNVTFVSGVLMAKKIRSAA